MVLREAVRSAFKFLLYSDKVSPFLKAWKSLQNILICFGLHFSFKLVGDFSFFFFSPFFLLGFLGPFCFDFVGFLFSSFELFFGVSF